MSAPDAMAGAASASPRTSPGPWTRLFYWSIRRELWENRSIYVAPLIVAGLALFGFLIAAVHPPHLQGLDTMDPAHRAMLREAPYGFAALALIVVSLVVGAFYCLGALHGERRDRSILFWKSLPVSDLTAVLAKAAIPMAVLPAVTFVVTFATQLIMRLISIAAMISQRSSAFPLWAHVPVIERAGELLYGLVTLSLWYAPIYGWLLLVSAWARRTPILWALGPVLALCVVEKLAFNTANFAALMHQRLIGSFAAAFKTVKGGGDGDMQIDPGGFVSSPGLWTGLIIGAAFIAGAVWLRRRGEPI